MACGLNLNLYFQNKQTETPEWDNRRKDYYAF